MDVVIFKKYVLSRVLILQIKSSFFTALIFPWKATKYSVSY